MSFKSIHYFYTKCCTVQVCNLAKRGMKISDPIFPIEMDFDKRESMLKDKRGIFLQLK